MPGGAGGPGHCGQAPPTPRVTEKHIQEELVFFVNFFFGGDIIFHFFPFFLKFFFFFLIQVNR